MTQWHWQTWQDLPYLTCDLLGDVPHGFFTQQFSPRVPAELVRALHPMAAAYRVKQVHDNTVLLASEIEPSLMDEADVAYAEADGLVATQPQQSVWACSADCTPLLMVDRVTGAVAAVHAGWRGTAAKIGPVAIARLLSQGSQLANLRIAMGPAIAGEVYQVSTTVAAQVAATVIPDAEPEEVLAKAQNLSNPPILSDSQPGRARLDVRRVNALQLEQLGIASEQIAIAPFCTFQTPELFFSYRRDRLKKVQWSGIVSRGS